MGVLELLESGMSTYCENGIGLFSSQPLNTISNIAILISAYFSYQLIRTHHIKKISIAVLPLIAAILGVGSILWHGAPNLITSFADTLPLSIFLLISFFFLLDKILPNRGLAPVILLAFMLIEVPFMFGILPSFNGFIPYLIALIFGLFIFFGLARKYNDVTLQMASIIPLFVTAFFFRTIDLTICSAFPIGTHFIWHILNAVVLYLFTRLIVKIEIKQPK